MAWAGWEVLEVQRSRGVWFDLVNTMHDDELDGKQVTVISRSSSRRKCATPSPHGARRVTHDTLRQGNTS